MVSRQNELQRPQGYGILKTTTPVKEAMRKLRLILATRVRYRQYRI